MLVVVLVTRSRLIGFLKFRPGDSSARASEVSVCLCSRDCVSVWRMVGVTRKCGQKGFEQESEEGEQSRC